MKYTFVLVVILPLKLFSQEKVAFTNDKEHYTISINSSATYQTQELENGYVDVFIISSEESQVDYFMTVTRVTIDVKEDFLKSGEYKKGFLSSCNCDLQKEYFEIFSNYEGLFFEISQMRNGQTFQGLIASIVQGVNLYSIGIYSSNEDFEVYEDELRESLETIILR